MTMIRVSPLEVQVRTDWFAGMPRAIRLAGEELPVLAVTRVRAESAAYPVAVGPRTCFEVVTQAARFALVYTHRNHRWAVEGLEAAGAADGLPGDEPRGGMLARAA